MATKLGAGYALAVLDGRTVPAHDLVVELDRPPLGLLGYERLDAVRQLDTQTVGRLACLAPVVDGERRPS